MPELTTLAIKDPGEPKELHDARLADAPVLLDLHTWAETFSATVLPLEQRLPERDLPVDAGIARSVLPPATAALRDFSGLSPRLPEVIAERCVGCMACVNACPDTAILGIVVPEADLDGHLEAFAAGEADPAAAVRDARDHFVRTRKYAEVPEKRGDPPGMFGLFVDPGHCKGCSECVAVCADLGHDALIMVDKVAATADTPGTVERARRDMRAFRSLPTTPAVYRNEKALADLMLGEHALGYVGGAGSCSGCGEATLIRMMVAATLGVYGPDSMGVVAATGCNTVYGSTWPFNPYRVPWTSSLFENAPADALGIRARWDQAGHADRRLWVIGGDGAMFDIGFQSLSRMIASGADIKVLVLDTQSYSNTGGQASTASFGGQVTKLSAYGRELHGRPEARKELARILMAHREVYVAQTTAAHVNHAYRAFMEANSYPGPAVIVAHAPCQPEHGIPDDASARQSKLAVTSRLFPLLTYDPRRGPRMRDRLSLQGNPALDADWATDPDGRPVDILAFAATEGRFAAHVAGPVPTPEILATQAERLANWRELRELAGV